MRALSWAGLYLTLHGVCGQRASHKTRGRSRGTEERSRQELSTCLPPLVIPSVNLYVSNELLPVLSLTLKLLIAQEGDTCVNKQGQDIPFEVVVYSGPKVGREVGIRERGIEQ